MGPAENALTTVWTAPSKGTGGANVNCFEHNELVLRHRSGSSSNREFKHVYLKGRQLAQAIVSSGSLECAHSQSEQIEQDACVSCTRKVWRKVESILYKQSVSWCEMEEKDSSETRLYTHLFTAAPHFPPFPRQPPTHWSDNRQRWKFQDNVERARLSVRAGPSSYLACSWKGEACPRTAATLVFDIAGAPQWTALDHPNQLESLATTTECGRLLR